VTLLCCSVMIFLVRAPIESNRRVVKVDQACISSARAVWFRDGYAWSTDWTPRGHAKRSASTTIAFFRPPPPAPLGPSWVWIEAQPRPIVLSCYRVPFPSIGYGAGRLVSGRMALSAGVPTTMYANPVRWTPIRVKSFSIPVALTFPAPLSSVHPQNSTCGLCYKRPALY